MTETIQAYLETFDRWAKPRKANGGSWTSPIREKAMARFVELGFPTPQDEDWKYTSVEPLTRTAFQPVGNGLPLSPSDRFVSPPISPSIRNQLVFINGHYAEMLSSLQRLPKGAIVGSLKTAIQEHRNLIEPYLARYADHFGQAFVALNTAFMEDGAFIFIPKNTVLAEPIHLVFVTTSGNGRTFINPRNLILMERQSEGTVLENYVGLGSEPYFTNSVTEIIGGENSVLEYYKVQKEWEEAFHIATAQIHLGRDCQFASRSISLGAALSRQDLNVRLDGEGISCVLDGLYVGTGSQHMDHHTVIDHLKPHGTSRELYKGILGERARGVFNGKIVVHQDAQKTDAAQTNKNLLLSEEALADTNPQLEIYADDVKCTHGSTIGQLEEDSVFYLRSRGIRWEEAQVLLAHAFASDLIDRLKIDSVRNELEKLLADRLDQNRRSK